VAGSATEFNAGNSGAAITIDFATNGPFQVTTLTGDTAFTLTPPSTVRHVQLRIVPDGSQRAPTWPGTVKWINGAVYTPSSSAALSDILTFFWNGTNYFASFSKGFA
jgi:hypothetical protein